MASLISSIVSVINWEMPLWKNASLVGCPDYKRTSTMFSLSIFINKILFCLYVALFY